MALDSSAPDGTVQGAEAGPAAQIRHDPMYLCGEGVL